MLDTGLASKACESGEIIGDAERRRMPRIAAREALVVTILAQSFPPISGVVENSSASGLRLITSSPLALGSPLRLQTQGLMLLGEVIYCEPRSGEYAVGISLEHSLDLEALERWLDRGWQSSD